jgi:hypothetical protein
MGLYRGGAHIWGPYTWTIFCVSTKQVSHKQENKHVLKEAIFFNVFAMKSVQNLKSFWRSSQNYFVLALFSSL